MARKKGKSKIYVLTKEEIEDNRPTIELMIKRVEDKKLEKKSIFKKKATEIKRIHSHFRCKLETLDRDITNIEKAGKQIIGPKNYNMLKADYRRKIGLSKAPKFHETKKKKLAEQENQDNNYPQNDLVEDDDVRT